MSSVFLYHEACPKCGSSDACGVYDDGHKYCFSCKYYLKATKSSITKELEEEKKKKHDDLISRLPSDFTTDISQKGLKWLQKYGLKSWEIVKHRFGWSQSGFMIAKKTPTPIQYSPLLVMPIFDLYENLIMWQARYFGLEPKAPKYWTVGNRDCLHIIHEKTVRNPSSLVLVEDLISAIKVSRYFPSMPIFGSDISNNIITRLHSRYENLIIWLDKDKRYYAEVRSRSIQPLFKSVKVIHSECDPKEYNDEELQSFLV